VLLRFLRTAALVFSPKHLPAKVKNVVLWLRLRNDAEAQALWQQYFTAEDYLSLNPDVALGGVNPATHFLLCSSREFRNPSSRFDTRYYLGRYPSVADSGVNPLLHYALFGKREGRTICRRTTPQELQAPSLEVSITQPPILTASIEGPVEQSPYLNLNNDWRRDYPLVSAVIPVFNNAQFLEEGVRSILNQTFQDVELIVVEGGSTDGGTVETVRRLETLGLPKTRFYYRPERHHVGDNKNFGAGVSRARYVFCLDQDDMIGGVYLEVAVFLAEVFGYDLVYPSLRAFGDPNVRWAYGDSNLRWLVDDPSYPQILCENQVPNCALCRRSAWAHIGGYRDFGTFEQYISEDWDFWIRYLGHGFRGISIRQCLHLYRVHDSGMTASYKPDMDEQRKRLRGVNASLIDSWRPGAEVLRSILNPYANLGPLETQQRGVILGLPATASETTQMLSRVLGDSVVAQGDRLLAVTSWTPAEESSDDAWSIPDDPYHFDGVTSYVYHLSWLFHKEAHREEFLRYLIRRYRVHTIMSAGCELLERMLPLLRAEFPYLVVVVDQSVGREISASNT
jgi:glycosyltransferase involved in cell wall biosynthesis